MAENNRVLNHSEFAAKYNQQSEQDIAASYSEFAKASDNFQEGFDDSTYEEGQAGPKRPLTLGAEETPAAPDSMPTEPTEGMAAPNDVEREEMEDHITPEEMEGEGEEEEEMEDDFDEDGSGDPEAGESDDEEGEGEEEEEMEDDFDEDGSGDPEAGESDDEEGEEDEDEDEEEEEANESVRVVRNSLILESFDDFEARGPIHMPRGASGSDMYADDVDTIELDFEGEDEDEDGDCFVTCSSCGSKKGIEKGSYPMGIANQEDPDSWWQGAEMGMQCGCK